MRSIRALTGLALAGAVLAMVAPHAQAVSASCQQALDDAQIAERNYDTVSKDPNTSEEDRKNAENEANMTASTAQLYSAAIDMCAWAEDHNCLAVVLCEHHGSEDGYLPAPLILASAIAARTQRLDLAAQLREAAGAEDHALRLAGVDEVAHGGFLSAQSAAGSARRH